LSTSDEVFCLKSNEKWNNGKKVENDWET